MRPTTSVNMSYSLIEGANLYTADELCCIYPATKMTLHLGYYCHKPGNFAMICKGAIGRVKVTFPKAEPSPVQYFLYLTVLLRSELRLQQTR